MNATVAIPLRSPQVSALEMLRKVPLLSIPRGICHGASLWAMSNLGLIEKSEWPGLWQVTEFGRTAPVEIVDITEASPLHKIDYAPSEEMQRAFLTAYGEIDRLQPGAMLLSQLVRRGALDFLEQRPRHYKFVYFAYPAGIPLKHIAWTVNQAEGRQWRGHHVSQARVEIGLPALRKRYSDANIAETCAALANADPLPCDVELYEELIREGCSPEEIREYFALPEGRRRVL